LNDATPTDPTRVTLAVALAPKKTNGGVFT
jgi:hypothetical protein